MRTSRFCAITLVLSLGTIIGLLALAPELSYANNESGSLVAADTCMHDWEDWDYLLESIEPSCSGSSSITRYCSKCGKSETKSIPALEHDWGYWEEEEEPTCTDMGTEVRRCYECNAEEYRDIPANGHDWDSWETVKRATKFATGKKMRQCYECSKKQYKAIPKKTMTKTDKKVVASTKKLLKALKSYNTKTLSTLIISDKTDSPSDASGEFDDMVASITKTYKKQFKKKLSYEFKAVSSNAKTATVKVKVTHPYAYNNYYRAYSHWYEWCLRNAYSASEDQMRDKLIKQLTSCISGNKMYKESTTITMRLSKTNGKWKIHSSSKLEDIVSCGFDKATDQFRYDKYLD